MKRARRIILPIVMAVVLTLITCIPIFALDTIDNYFKYPPDDLGTIYNGWTNSTEGYAKFYMKIDAYNLSPSDFYIKYEGNFYFCYFDITNNKLTIVYYDFPFDNNFMVIIPDFEFEIESQYYYIPIYLYNCTLACYNTSITSYLSSTTDTNVIIREAFDVGYQNGYVVGMRDGMNSDQYTNITGYVTQLLTRFVGSDAATYITPIAIVLVILFVYFLFIRFLLSLIKAKGVIKTCDIVMVVACILILVVMYAPMLNITINKNIRTDTIETSETTETTQIRRTDYIYDEQGRIISGPGGTVIYDEVESTTSEQEQTEVEVTTQPTEKEITTYEETKENIIRS